MLCQWADLRSNLRAKRVHVRLLRVLGRVLGRGNWENQLRNFHLRFLFSFYTRKKPPLSRHDQRHQKATGRHCPSLPVQQVKWRQRRPEKSNTRQHLRPGNGRQADERLTKGRPCPFTLSSIQNLIKTTIFKLMALRDTLVYDNLSTY